MKNDDCLFSAAKILREPLAARMRPRNLDEYIGQDHIIGKGRLLRRAVAADQLTSVIFCGPPGSGKTTLARVIANHTKSNFITLNAVLTGVSEIRNSIRQAEDYFNLYSKRTILFVDEVHRWNKSQQDALLPWVENGTIVLIGATTENPFFEVNKALVSRSRIFQLTPLSLKDLEKAAFQALSDTERGYGKWNVTFEKGALEHLIKTANGDARSLLNAVELAVETTPEKWEPYAEPPVPEYGSVIYVSKEAAEQSIQKKAVLYDKDGDFHYDIISAFIKSIRGRDPDAAVYWLARMCAAGEDPHFIFRRMLISACEDTGLADPHAVTVVNSCAQAFDRVGLPEGRYFLAHAALYLSTAPKSNSSMAFFDALAEAEKEYAEVPNHLKDASRDSCGFGHGSGYVYPHAYKEHWVAQQYLPANLADRVFYNPSTQGYENKIREEVLSRREVQIAAVLENANLLKNNFQKKNTCSNSNEPLQTLNEWWINRHFNGNEPECSSFTFSPADTAKETALEKADKQWKQRIDSNKAEILLLIRDTAISCAKLLRHHRCLIWNADDGLFLWETARKTPEGAVCGVCRSIKGKEILEQYGRTLDGLDKPMLIHAASSSNMITPKMFKDILMNFQYGGIIFDRFFFRDPFNSIESIKSLAACVYSSLFLQKAKGKIFIDDFDAEKIFDCINQFNIEKKDKTNESEYSEESPFASGWKIIISQRIPSKNQRISSVVKEQILTPDSSEHYLELLEKMQEIEDEFFSDITNTLFNWDEKTVEDIFINSGFAVNYFSKGIIEKRKISKEEIKRWFDPVKSAYGKKLQSGLGGNSVKKIVLLLENSAEKMIFNWYSQTSFFEIKVQGNI